MNNLFPHILGLLLAFAAPMGARAQSDWRTQPAGGNDYNGGCPTVGTLPGEPAQALRPFENGSGVSQPAAYRPADANVVRADYETTAERPAADARFAQPGASMGSPGAAEGVVAPVHSGASPPKDTGRLARGEKSARLLPRSAPSQTGHGPASGLDRAWTTGAALALVLGLFCVVAWIMRRASPRTTAPLPTEVVETLGRAPLTGRQNVHLVRCGRKLLLVSVTPERAATLTEITDPIEVDRLTGLCDRSRGGNAAATFRQMFEQFSHTSRRPLADDGEELTDAYYGGDRRSLREGRNG